jgi:hypothetical protein
MYSEHSGSTDRRSRHTTHDLFVRVYFHRQKTQDRPTGTEYRRRQSTDSSFSYNTIIDAIEVDFHHVMCDAPEQLWEQRLPLTAKASLMREHLNPSNKARESTPLRCKL